jgi:hypothetical protein
LLPPAQSNDEQAAQEVLEQLIEVAEQHPKFLKKQLTEVRGCERWRQLLCSGGGGLGRAGERTKARGGWQRIRSSLRLRQRRERAG